MFAAAVAYCRPEFLPFRQKKMGIFGARSDCARLFRQSVLPLEGEGRPLCLFLYFTVCIHFGITCSLLFRPLLRWIFFSIQLFVLLWEEYFAGVRCTHWLTTLAYTGLQHQTSRTHTLRNDVPTYVSRSAAHIIEDHRIGRQAISTVGAEAPVCSSFCIL